MSTIVYARSVGRPLVHASDTPPMRIPRLLAIWLVLRLAQMCVGGYEVGVNDGPLVRLFHRVTGTAPGAAWCAAFEAFCALILGSTNPLPPIAYCPDLAAWGQRHGVMDAAPEVGDILLLWEHVHGEEVPRFAHTTWVLAVHADGSVGTCEGNTNTDGSRDGYEVCPKVRHLGPGDRVVHWHHLIPE